MARKAGRTKPMSPKAGVTKTISLNHSKSNLLKINDEVGSIRYWALKIGKAHSVLSYRLKVHGIDNLRKYIEQRIKLV